MLCFLLAVGLSVASAFAVRFGLRGSLWVGGAIGLVLFYGVALPLLARFEGEYRLTDPTSFFLTMGAFAIASAALGVLGVFRRRRKILLVLSAVLSLPMAVQVFHFTPVPAWGLAVVGFIPAAVLLANVLCVWVWERVEADSVHASRGAC